MRVRLAAVMAVLFVLFPVTAERDASKHDEGADADIAAAPPAGPAWTKASAAAELARTCVPSLTVLTDDCDVDTLAAAYKAVRLNDATLYQAVQNRIGQLPTTPTDRALELARNLTSYMIAADVIDLPTRNPTLNATFTSWLDKLATTYPTTGGDCPTLTRCEELRPNNWGAMSAAALAAINAYLGNATRLDHVYDVEKAWAGVRSGTYNPASFNFAPNAVSYGPDGSTEATLVAINPAGAVTQAHDTDGLQPDDQRRRTTVTTATGMTITDAPFVWPLPKDTSYPWESLQGRIVAAQILTRSGRDMYQVAGLALRRTTSSRTTASRSAARWPTRSSPSPA